MGKSTLTLEQTRVLEHLRAHGGVLVRWRGGFWTTPDTPVELRTGSVLIPKWYAQIQTVRAMERKGLLVRTNRFLEEWRDDRRLTT